MIRSVLLIGLLFASTAFAGELVTTKVMRCSSDFPESLRGYRGNSSFAPFTVGVIRDFELSLTHAKKGSQDGIDRLQKLEINGELNLLPTETFLQFSQWSGDILFGSAQASDASRGVLRVSEQGLQSAQIGIAVEDFGFRNKPGFVFYEWSIHPPERASAVSARGLEGTLGQLWYISLEGEKVVMTFSGLQDLDGPGYGDSIWRVEANNCRFYPGVDQSFLEKFNQERDDD